MFSENFVTQSKDPFGDSSNMEESTRGIDHVWTRNNIRWYQSHRHAGTGAGYNRLLDLVRTEFYMQLEDDWLLNNESNLVDMRTFLQEQSHPGDVEATRERSVRCDVIGGVVGDAELGNFAVYDTTSEAATLIQKRYV